MTMLRRYSIIFLLTFVVFLAMMARVSESTSQASNARTTDNVSFFSQTALRSQVTSSGAPLFLGNDRSVMLWEYGCGVASLAMVFHHYGVDTDVVRLNEALRAEGAFSGALLAWDRRDTLLQAGQPWIQSIERVNTRRPRDFQQRVDDELAANRPVIAYLGARHYVVLVGKDERDGYLINDPWKLTAEQGQAIALEQNDLKLKFDDIRQFIFIHPDRNAPTNAIAVNGSIADKYYSLGGSKGLLGNPVAAVEMLTGGGRWQRFERGAILAPAQGVFVLHGPIWEKFQAEGGVAKMGLPRSDNYSYFVGPAVEWRADFSDASIVWSEGESRARLLTPANALRAEYFANPDLAGTPVYTRFEEYLLFDWQSGAPGPWVEPDGFSARYTATISVGGFGWWYNFVVDADDAVRISIDGDNVLEGWTDSATVHRFTHYLGNGEHTLLVEYREGENKASLRAGWSAWPASPVFASEQTAGSFELLPASAAESAPEMHASIAEATTVAAAVIATLTAEVQVTPTPANSVEPLAEATFTEWASGNGEPYRDVQVSEESNDGFFAGVRVRAWFRPSVAAPWEEREALVECRQVGGVWQCARELRFALSAGEIGRRTTATAQALAPIIARTSEEILIPAGEFVMGSPDGEGNDDERPQHTVYLDAYYIDKYEVTTARYQACVDAGACDALQESSSATRESYFGNPEYADYPVINVTWYQAEAFCTWEGRRLPTEAEWEKAARGTDGRTYPWGNEAPDAGLLNYDGNVGDTTPVGSYPSGASPYGVMDMAGNVWEWVNDWYGEDYYRQSPRDNPPGPATGAYRVLRGGSWYCDDDSVRSACRGLYSPVSWSYSLGFRCVRSQ
jgi:formylglycine-generating enzyme required for sulfatase activity